MWGHFTLSHSTGFPSPSSNHKFYYNDSVTILTGDFSNICYHKTPAGQSSQITVNHDQQDDILI